MDEELKSLAEELELSEDIFLKLKLVVEGYVQDKVEKQLEELTAQHTEIVENLEAELEYVKEKAEEFGTMLQEKAEAYGQELQLESDAAIAQVKEETLEEANKYAEYVIEKFITENKEKFIQEAKFKKMESVFESIKETFEKQGFILEHSDVTDNSELTEAKEQYSILMNDYTELKESHSKLQKEILFEEKTKSLADTQKEKVSSLIESINPKSLEEYGKGLDIIVSGLDKTLVTESIEEPTEEDVKETKTSRVTTYAKYL